MHKLFYFVWILIAAVLVDVALRIHKVQNEVSDLQSALKFLRRAVEESQRDLGNLKLDLEKVKGDVKYHLLHKVRGRIDSTLTEVLSGSASHLFDEDMETCVKWESGEKGKSIWFKASSDTFIEHMRVKVRGQSAVREPSVKLRACFKHDPSAGCYDHEDCLWMRATAGGLHVFHCNKYVAALFWIIFTDDLVEVCEVEMYGYEQETVEAPTHRTAQKYSQRQNKNSHSRNF